MNHPVVGNSLNYPLTFLEEEGSTTTPFIRINMDRKCTQIQIHYPPINTGTFYVGRNNMHLNELSR
jgi:hypothetical protein